MTLAASGLLFQVRPDVLIPVVALRPTIATEITRLLICNPTTSASSYSIYHRADGQESLNSLFVLYSEVSLSGGQTAVIEALSENSGFGLRDGDVFGVQASIANSLVFTGYGVTANLAQGNLPA